MIKDITIGQYFPGESVIHRLDPRTKILLTIFYVVVLFAIQTMWGFLAAAVYMLSIILLSGISFKTVLKSVKPLAFIIVFTAVFNMIYAGGTPIFAEVNWLKWLTYDGVRRAAFMAIRIILLVMGTSFMTYTTSPIMLTGAMESLLSPLKLVKAPVHELSMMMTIALRFIPTLVDETDKIMNAQKARGADFETGNIFRRAKALIPILVPLLISAFRRAEELADAMECRCYNGGDGRTKYKIYHFALRDLWAMLVSLLLLAAVILLNVLL
ncbi:MAG: energy-coupling factor transporter transmembrane protein EcfT [Clostridia bacterium]|nr:energy-coupling factor transporter transmembrane protein EcfT [Clostridia bacterium]